MINKYSRRGFARLLSFAIIFQSSQVVLAQECTNKVKLTAEQGQQNNEINLISDQETVNNVISVINEVMDAIPKRICDCLTSALLRINSNSGKPVIMLGDFPGKFVQSFFEKQKDSIINKNISIIKIGTIKNSILKIDI